MRPTKLFLTLVQVGGGLLIVGMVGAVGHEAYKNGAGAAATMAGNVIAPSCVKLLTTTGGQ